MLPENEPPPIAVIYGISNCDTIKRTLAWFKDHQQEVILHDYRRQGISPELADQLLTRFSPDELVNKRGTTWRKLVAAARIELTPESMKALILEHPSVIRRPVIEAAGNWIVGYDTDLFETLTRFK